MERNLYTVLPNHPGDIPEGTLRAMLRHAKIENISCVRKQRWVLFYFKVGQVPDADPSEAPVEADGWEDSELLVDLHNIQAAVPGVTCNILAASDVLRTDE